MKEQLDGLTVYKNAGNGYDYIKISEGYHIPLHDYIIQKKIGRELKQTEVVHHIDRNTKNNNLDNLFLCDTRTKHSKIHTSLRRLFLNKIFKVLFDNNILYFDCKHGKYKINDIKLLELKNILDKNEELKNITFIHER